MKKNILFILSILVFSTVFVSCGDDEDEQSDSSATLYVDDRQINVIQDLNVIWYRYKYESKTIFDMNVYIYADDADVGIFSIQLLNLDMDKIEVGDNLSDEKNYTVNLAQKGGGYTLNDLIVTDKDRYEQYKGKVIVKAIDKNKKTIQLDFSNITLPLHSTSDGPNFKYLAKVKGSISATMEQRNTPWD